MPAPQVLNGYPEDIKKLEKQLGCMAGIFQIFDRHHLLAGQRSGWQGQRRLPTGHAQIDGRKADVQNSRTSQISLGKNLTKCSAESSSFSMESRPSFSSLSSSDSPSSLDGRKSIQEELPIITEVFFTGRSANLPPRPNNPYVQTKQAMEETAGAQANSMQSHTDLRNIVKDSINREVRAICVKGPSEEKSTRNGVRHMDSPRPVPLSKPLTGVQVTSIDRGLKDSSRFSCDGREYLASSIVEGNRAYTTRLEDLPRLSLDSRKEYLRTSSSDLKQGKKSFYSTADEMLLESVTPRRSHNVIAKLMGLEVEPQLNCVTPAKISNAQDLARSVNEQPINQHSVLKMKPSLRMATEAAPWWQEDRTGCAKTEFVCRDEQPKPRKASIYTDIETRLKELEFLESNKDFRALRILGSQQAMAASSTAGHEERHTQLPTQELRAQASARHGRSFASTTAPKHHIQATSILKDGINGSNSKLPDKIQICATRPTSRGANEANHSVTSSSPRSFGQLSPRCLIASADAEKKLRCPVSSTEPHKTIATPLNKPSLASVSPKGRLRPKGLPRKNCAVKSLGSQDDDPFVISESKMYQLAQAHRTFLSPQKPLGAETSFVQECAETTMCMKDSPRGITDDIPEVKAVFAPQENVPSPVSVLDASLYKDAGSPSLKIISSSFKDGETHTSDECWNPVSMPDTPPSKMGSEVDQMRPENFNALIQKLEQLSTAEDEPLKIDNKNHLYIYEILSASGLLKDLSFLPGSITTPPINGDLFFVLEQTWADHHQNGNAEKIHRRLVFDLTNEIVGQKMELLKLTPHQNRLFEPKMLNGQQLFRDLCAEIDGFGVTESKCDDDQDEDNLAEHVVNQMKEWRSSDTELQRVVLDIERSIFRDLIDEVVVGGNAAGGSARKLKRQLFLSVRSI